MQEHAVAVGPNGSVRLSSTDLSELAAQSEAALEAQAADLHGLIERERAGREFVERLVEESKEREKRLVKALAAITGVTQTRPSPVGRRRGRPPKSGAKNQVWDASPTKREAVFAVLEAADAPLNITAIARRASISPETVRRAIRVLRADQRVRLTHDDPRLGMHYAVMPGGSRAA